MLNRICHLADSLEYREKQDSIKPFSLQAIKTAKKINYSEGLAKALYTLGNYNIRTYQLAEATQNFLESLELYKQLKKDTSASKCYMQLGVISYLLQYYEAAIKNFKLSLKKITECNKQLFVGHYLHRY